MNHQVLVVAGEASSALYAQRLIEKFKEKNSDIHFFGVGTKEMEALGFERLGCSEEMAVVGIQEVISHWSIIKGAFNNLVNEAKKRKPQVALLLDYPDFNLRLAKKLKEMNIPIVYYISPQVWAWRKSRIHLIKKVVNKMLVVFPFEEPFYKEHNVPVSFVGHPLLDELNTNTEESDWLERERGKFGIRKNEKLIGLMPGSRRSEIKNHLAVQLETAKMILEKNKNYKIAIFVAPTLNLNEIKEHLNNLDFPIILIQRNPMEMIPLADIILAASGTATLLVGLLQIPMVIMYKMNAFTAYLAKKFVKDTPFFGMINLILKKEVCPEFFQENATPDILSKALLDILENDENYLKTKNELKLAKEVLGNQGATEKVLIELEEFLI